MAECACSTAIWMLLREASDVEGWYARGTPAAGQRYLALTHFLRGGRAYLSGFSLID